MLRDKYGEIDLAMINYNAAGPILHVSKISPTRIREKSTSVFWMKY